MTAAAAITSTQNVMRVRGSSPQPDFVLDSWKEIATFLRRSVRTVQRWERCEGLPVLRHHHLKRGSVYAEKEHLLAWLDGRKAHSRRSPTVSTPTALRPCPDVQPVQRLLMLTRRQRILVSELKMIMASCQQTRGSVARAYLTAPTPHLPLRPTPATGSPAKNHRGLAS